MERTAFKQLAEWKATSDRKPLIIKGARQTGKTWLMKEFGSRGKSGRKPPSQKFCLFLSKIPARIRLQNLRPALQPNQQCI